jgi:phosphatidate cytidylyltransferase
VTSRLISTFALWALVFAAVGFFGATGGVCLLALLAVLAQFELQGLLEKSGLAPWRLAPLAIGAAMVLNAGGLCPDYGNFIWLIAAVALTVAALPIATSAAALPKLAGSVLALAYVPGMMQYYAFMVRDFGGQCPRGGGVGLAIWVIAAAKFTDVGGYLLGSMIGRHKLAPSISPGKTWEGVAGGLALSAFVAALIAHFARDFLPLWLTTIHAAELALPIAAVSIVSDLAESAFKRRAGVKDSGRCIPGIGGALDLADSLLLAGPVAYYLFVLAAR